VSSLVIMWVMAFKRWIESSLERRSKRWGSCSLPRSKERKRVEGAGPKRWLKQASRVNSWFKV
jgi:hypothetical protein